MSGASGIGLVVSTFLASAVEFVEAFTIVLAMGLTRGWRSALWGAVAAVAALAAATAVFGYALTRWLPESALQLGIGTLLLIFGLQWLRKAILRSAGLKALHDEEATFREEQAAARAATAERHLGIDGFGFAVSFKGVFLEGLEVVFIVITFGLNAGAVPLRRRRGGGRGAARRRRRRRRPPAARAGAGEHHQVRRRPAADDVRHVLGDRGSRRVRRRLAAARVAGWRRRPARGTGRLDRCSRCSPSGCCGGAPRGSATPAEVAP